VRKDVYLFKINVHTLTSKSVLKFFFKKINYKITSEIIKTHCKFKKAASK
jgi:hypothetical protein